MTHLELRKKFLDFWKEKNHAIISSSPLVPENDPTTLFTGSGMQPMMPYLLGTPHPLGTRLVDIQKCFRGQDIEEVGDNRHDSFFEMLGNWSLGDYFKKDQITWYFEFLTTQLNIPKEKLHVTVFGGNDLFDKDTEAIEIWGSLGVPQNHIHPYDVKKNWWSRAGTPDEMPVGEPGGPDSEVFYDFGFPVHEGCHPNCDCGRFMEIGNNVFMTYLKTNDGFVPLKKKNIDFGGGLERTLAAINNDPDIFRTDLYSLEIDSLEKLSNKKYGEDENITRVFRIIADHIKAAVFLISDGIVPSNKDRGYVLRRLIRRSIRFSKNLEINQEFVSKVADAVIATYQEPYPELGEFRDKIISVLLEEEKKFRRTFEQGLKLIGMVSPFDLYQSYGFPPEVTEEIYKEKGLNFDKKLLEAQIKKHQELSRSASQKKFKGGLADHSEIVTKYHTATHLLQKALRVVLGESVHQEGSNLTAERLRFDFSFSRKLTEEEIRKITEIVNEQIEKGLERKVETMTYEEALKSGALAFFKERYPEKVTVYSFGNFSKEICGGPHVENTKTLGKFKIIKEEAIAAGTRRIYGKIY